MQKLLLKIFSNAHLYWHTSAVFVALSDEAKAECASLEREREFECEALSAREDAVLHKPHIVNTPL